MGPWAGEGRTKRPIRPTPPTLWAHRSHTPIRRARRYSPDRALLAGLRGASAAVGPPAAAIGDPRERPPVAAAAPLGRKGDERPPAADQKRLHVHLKRRQFRDLV